MRAPEVISASLWSLKILSVLPPRGLCPCCSPDAAALLSPSTCGLWTSPSWTSSRRPDPKSSALPRPSASLFQHPASFASEHIILWAASLVLGFSLSTVPPNPTPSPDVNSQSSGTFSVCLSCSLLSPQDLDMEQMLSEHMLNKWDPQSWTVPEVQ